MEKINLYFENETHKQEFEYLTFKYRMDKIEKSLAYLECADICKDRNIRLLDTNKGLSFNLNVFKEFGTFSSSQQKIILLGWNFWKGGVEFPMNLNVSDELDFATRFSVADILKGLDANSTRIVIQAIQIYATM